MKRTLAQAIHATKTAMKGIRLRKRHRDRMRPEEGPGGEIPRLRQEGPACDSSLSPRRWRALDLWEDAGRPMPWGSCVALLSPGACPPVRSAGFAVHLGHPGSRLARALHLPWARQCLAAALFCSRVHCPRLRSASLPPLSCHSLCQLASCARPGYPGSRMAAVALRPYLMQGSTALFLCSSEYTPSSKRHRLVRISGTTPKPQAGLD